MAEAGSEFILGVVGWPLEVSLSPVIHREFFRLTGLSGEYRKYPLRPGELKRGIVELEGRGLDGFNVTFPHKRAAAGLCDSLAGDASILSAVNTVRVARGLEGHNTDVYGFERFMDACCLEGPFFIAGSGGVAMAADLALARRGFRAAVYCRNPGGWRGSAPAYGLGSLVTDLGRTGQGTLVNATTLGWNDEDVFPVEVESLAGVTFADLNYNPSWTWREGLRSAGVGVHTGETMLAHQAARSFEIWTGVMPPAESVIVKISRSVPAP